MGVFFINRDPDSLAHASHKYVDRKWKGGKWVYTYAEDGKNQGKNLKSHAKSNGSGGWGKLTNMVNGAVENKKVADRKTRATNEGGKNTGDLKNNARRRANANIDNKEYNTPWAREAAGSTSGKYNTAMASPTRKKAEAGIKDRHANEGVMESRNAKDHARAAKTARDNRTRATNTAMGKLGFGNAGSAANGKRSATENEGGNFITRKVKNAMSGYESGRREDAKNRMTNIGNASRVPKMSKEYYQEVEYNRKKNRYRK